jgi:hypothetical protein
VQSEEARDEEDYDHDADDVENIHCVHRLRGARLQYEETARSNRKRPGMEVSSIISPKPFTLNVVALVAASVAARKMVSPWFLLLKILLH